MVKLFSHMGLQEATPQVGISAQFQAATGAASRESIRKEFLHPGRVLVSSTPCEITTILGSCVAVCLFDPVLRIGGVNHFMFPSSADPTERSARFGTVAMEILLSEMVKLGAFSGKLQAKVYGGGSLVAPIDHTGPTLGEKNIQFAREQLAKHRIVMVEAAVGGKHGRKIVFNSGDGSCLVKEL